MMQPSEGRSGRNTMPIHRNTFYPLASERRYMKDDLLGWLESWFGERVSQVTEVRTVDARWCRACFVTNLRQL